jgi:hypothetical protein
VVPVWQVLSRHGSQQCLNLGQGTCDLLLQWLLLLLQRQRVVPFRAAAADSGWLQGAFQGRRIAITCIVGP